MAANKEFMKLQPGTVVNGRYEIIKSLGTGSMGLVYVCRHLELAGHVVAMKVLFNEVVSDEVVRSRFINEIVASYGVNHPNVVRAYEYFQDGDIVAFTMEYVDGGDLADRLAMKEPIPMDQVIKWLKQMCQGVQAIHDAGIVHRDLKPENVMLTSTGGGDVKIADFGIAKTGTGPKLTEYGGVVGTIDYVSPEYLERGQVDERLDIYALGVLAYEMITGNVPFKGDSVVETMTLRLKTIPETPAAIRPECSEELGRIVMQALRREPGERYQKAIEMFHDLDYLAYTEQTFRYRGGNLDASVTGVPNLFDNEDEGPSGNEFSPEEEEDKFYQDIVSDPRYKKLTNTEIRPPKLRIDLIEAHKKGGSGKLLYLLLLMSGLYAGYYLYTTYIEPLIPSTPPQLPIF